MTCRLYSQLHPTSRYFMCFCIIKRFQSWCCFQNGISSLKKEVVNGQSKRTKRRKDSSDSSDQHKEKAKKSRKKKSKKSKERSEGAKRSCSPINKPSDPVPSDSEEDFSLCAAPWCREPEGDEVSFRSIHCLYFLWFTAYNLINVTWIQQHLILSSCHCIL